jgi:hypothetical protein
MLFRGHKNVMCGQTIIEIFKYSQDLWNLWDFCYFFLILKDMHIKKCMVNPKNPVYTDD